MPKTSASSAEHLLTLAELEQLARQPSSENWHTLLRGLTDHFLASADAYTELYGEDFSDIVLRLLGEVTAEARAELSSRIAPLEHFPDKIVKHLAHDEYAVAAPVLEQSSLLSDSDLIALVSLVMQEHLLAISRRKSLGARLTDALFQKDNQEVIREMAGNPGAKFSDATYRAVAEKAKKDVALQEKLVERPDLTPALAVQLNPFLSDELKGRLKALKAAPSAQKGLLESLENLDAGEEGDQPDPDLANVHVSIQKVREGQANASEIVTQLADQGRFSGVCIFLGGIADLPEKTISAALLNLNGLPIAVTCKGIGLSADAFEAICHLRCDRLRLPQTEIIKQVERYAGLNPADAKKTLAVLQNRKGKESGTSAA